MPEPLKNLYTSELINQLAKTITASHSSFESVLFQAHVFDAQWQDKELKERMKHIAEALYQFLPKPYSKAIEVLKTVSSNFSGFEYMFFPTYVELYGLDEYDISISALAHFTANSSAEFAVRPFIKQYPDKMMHQMERWAESDDEHLRRLASEGCRPRLPWAMALPDFKQDPTAILSILEKLKQDESEYVRRSVANNLNDIAKDNPQTVINIAQSWLGQHKDTDRLIKHACRTLLKQGAPEIMTLFNFAKPEHIKLENFNYQASANIGGQFEFSFTLNTSEQSLGNLRIEYAIDFMKKNGQQSRKIFKISESDLSIQKKHVIKKHPFKLISTRTYYPGQHGIEIIINGHELKKGQFELKLSSP